MKTRRNYRRRQRKTRKRVIRGGDDAIIIDPFKTFNVEKDKINSILISPDSKMIAAGVKKYESPGGGRLYIWPIDNNQNYYRKYEDHAKEITSLDFSVDNTFILSGSTDKMVKKRNIEYDQHESINYVDYLAFSGTNCKICPFTSETNSPCDTNKIKIEEEYNKKIISARQSNKPPTNNLCNEFKKKLSNIGRKPTKDNPIECDICLKTHKDRVNQVAFIDSKRILTLSALDEDHVKEWSIDGDLLIVYKFLKDNAAIEIKGNNIAYSLNGKTIAIWDYSFGSYGGE